MSFIQNFFTSRDNNANAATYVGQQDRLWWNPDTNAFYVNTANTPGGTPVTIASGSNLTLNNFTANSGTINNNLIVTGNISPAGANKIGGIFPGPGVVIGTNGQLTIDSANLPVSFGNFFANNNILSIINVDEDMILETSGNAEIQLIGNIGFYKPNGGGVPDPDNLFFFARDDGQLTIIVPAEDPFLGAVEIIGSSTGNLIPPGAPGAMLHITGNPAIPARVYLDGNGEYASFVARRYNGNVAVPTQVLAGQDVLRLNSTAATDAGMGNVAMAQIRTTALENQTTTAQGSSITFTVTPVGSSASSRVDVANVTVANGVTATRFTTAGTVTATGGITSGDGISDSKGDVRSIPLNTQNTGYTLVATDAGKLINMTTGNVTVPASVFATPFGQAITIYNNQNSSNAIVQGSGVTIRLAGTAATGNRTLARYGLATLVCVSANTFVISGAGLT
jgi:hypothetical protein